MALGIGDLKCGKDYRDCDGSVIKLRKIFHHVCWWTPAECPNDTALQGTHVDNFLIRFSLLEEQVFPPEPLPVRAPRVM